MTDPQPADAVEVVCPAKLNLTLAVGPVGADGYHRIASVMVALGFADALRIHRSEGESRFERRFADDAPKPQPIDWPIEQDLALRAHRVMEQEVGQPLPVACELSKRIPAGAGLGGGSSDAAGMLVGLRRCYGLAVSDARLIELGLSLGSDVGFLVAAQLGQRAGLVAGTGQHIAPLPCLPGFALTLIFPEASCPSGEIYRAFDAGHRDEAALERFDTRADLWAGLDELPDPQNDLTLAATHARPQIAAAVAKLTDLGYTAHLTGSGSALFVLAGDLPAAEAIANQARHAGLPAVASTYDVQSDDECV